MTETDQSLWFAKALTSRYSDYAPRPPDIYHAFSVVFPEDPHYRYYAFKEESNRDSFVHNFRMAKAEACENPRP